MVPIRAGPGVALETSYVGGTRQELLRSLCQFVNTTKLPLEVALLEEPDDSWTMLPLAHSSAAGVRSLPTAKVGGSRPGPG